MQDKIDATLASGVLMRVRDKSSVGRLTLIYIVKGDDVILTANK